MLRITRVHSDELKDEVFALRYRAYRHEEAIEQSDIARFEDKYDRQPNHVLWALTEHGKVVGSIRSTLFDPTQPWNIPEMDGYPEDVGRVVPAGSRIVSGNRFVIDPDRADRDSAYAMLLLRHHMLIAQQRADFALAAVRVNHLPFYRRVLKLERASEAKIYPGLTCQMFLTACIFDQHIESVFAATPTLRPRGYERVFTDVAYQDIWEVGMPLEI